MKKFSMLLIAIFIFFGCASNNKANDNDQVLLQQGNTHVVNGLTWYATLEEAMEVAQKKHKPILMQFSGSDWCKWCIKLNNEVFLTKEFTDWAKNNIILINLDFPRRTPQTEKVKQYNNAQMQKYGVRGFPTVLLLNEYGNVVQQTGYLPGGPTVYIKHIKEAYSGN